MMLLTNDLLEKLIAEEFSKSSNLQMTTGTKGVKSFIIAYLKESNLEINLANFIKYYKQFIKSGIIKRYETKL